MLEVSADEEGWGDWQPEGKLRVRARGAIGRIGEDTERNLDKGVPHHQTRWDKDEGCRNKSAFFGRLREHPKSFCRYPDNPAAPTPDGMPTPAEQLWNQAVVRNWRNMKKPFNQYPLIFQRGSSPWGSRCPAIMAVDSNGKLLPIAKV